jgi:hypothetical protein
MKKAYLIMVHKNPRQMARLIHSLNHPDVDFFIHVDKKSDAQPFKQISSMKHVNFISDRIDVDWGGFGGVEATLSLMNWTLIALMVNSLKNDQLMD